ERLAAALSPVGNIRCIHGGHRNSSLLTPWLSRRAKHSRGVLVRQWSSHQPRQFGHPFPTFSFERERGVIARKRMILLRRIVMSFQAEFVGAAVDEQGK